MYTTIMVDTTLFGPPHADDTLADENDTSVIYNKLVVNLHGGIAKFYDTNETEYDIELPDFSKNVYLVNETDARTSFSLSYNDIDSENSKSEVYSSDGIDLNNMPV
jgi:hypothetical protein